jgi:nifR3 family TIM-barrel protein
VALRIGNHLVDPPVVLAPMAGVTNTVFRGLCRRYGDGIFVSEMVSARGLVQRDPKSFRMVRWPENEARRSVQLYGVEPGVLGAAVRIVCEELGADHVDLNFGCPVAKVTRKGGGSAVPAHPVLFGAIVDAAVRAAGASGVPLTVKMRIGISDDLVTCFDAGRVAADAGAAAVALHARTAEQHYSGRARWDAIAELRSVVPAHVPVLGNGDIWAAQDAVRMMAETGCDGVVVGRGCLGRPWFFGELHAALTGRPIPPPPSLAEVCALAREHAALLAEEDGERMAMLQMRKHLGWYFHDVAIGGELRASLKTTESLAVLTSMLDEVATTARPPEHPPRPRGPTNGPRRVVLPDGWLDHRDDPTPPQESLADALAGG